MMTQITMPEIIVVASGKGGVGKTWFSITLASCLAKSHKKVLLFDGDIGLANIDIQLGLNPNFDLADVLQHNCQWQDAITTFSQKDFEFDIISGRSGQAVLSDLTSSQKAHLLMGLRHVAVNYDYMIIDVSAGIDAQVQMLADLGHRCLVVFNNEPTAITDAYAFMKIMHNKQPKLALELVVNLAEDPEQGQQTFYGLREVCVNFMRFTPEFGGIILKDPKVRDTICHQTPMLLRYPQSKASLCVAEIAKRIIENPVARNDFMTTYSNEG